MDNNVSIIIPVYTGHENLKYLLPAINQQMLLPGEIIIVDSCSHTEVEELIEKVFLILLMVVKSDFFVIFLSSNIS